MQPTLNPNLREFWETRTTGDNVPVRFRVLYGGRMSSKSHDVAGMAIARANFQQERFLCLRMYQNRIADSVYTLLKDKIEYFGLSRNFNIFTDAIEHKKNGSLFRFYGMARNLDDIKSFEGATVSWIEEAHNLTEPMFDLIRPTVMRNDGAEIWVTFNPRLSSDFAYKKLVLNPPNGTLTRQINYDENPFLSTTALADIESAKLEDYEKFQYIYLGVPRDNDDSVVIKRSWLQSAIDAHLTVQPSSGTWEGSAVVGYDVADSGNDKNAVVVMSGSICKYADEWQAGEDELRESSAKVKNVATTFTALTIGYDSIGVGAGTGSHLNSLGWKHHFKFNAGGAVADPKKYYSNTKIVNNDFFSNLKAQMWWTIADRLRNTHISVTKGSQFSADQMISLSSDINSKILDKLVDELSTPKRDFDNNGKVKVESKKDLAKRDIESPNVADAFVIACSRGLLSRRSLSEIL